MLSCDTVVVGAGVIGLAVGRELAEAGQDVIIAEAATVIGDGVSSRNSEVIHAGIYYPPGSLKAALCVEGRDRLYAYCAARGIAHRRCGKLIVAVEDAEVATLEDYVRLARANGAGDLAWRDAAAVHALEPRVRAVAGLWSPLTGIIDSHALLLALRADFEAAGGMIAFATPVQRLAAAGSGIAIDCADHDRTRLHARRVVNCAGLEAVRLAASVEAAGAPVPRAHFARGRYYTLGGPPPFRHLVYPIAEPGGLGVHVTIDLAGAVRFGPDVEWIEHPDYAFDDSARDRFIAAIRRYFPTLEAARLAPAYTGIRPKISGPGEPAADFQVQTAADHGIDGLVHLLGIESPGLTSALAIAARVRAVLA